MVPSIKAISICILLLIFKMGE